MCYEVPACMTQSYASDSCYFASAEGLVQRSACELLLRPSVDLACFDDIYIIDIKSTLPAAP